MNFRPWRSGALLALTAALLAFAHAPAPAAAQELPPRPTVAPTPPPAPTAPPADDSDSDTSDDGGAAPTGRITGTVIDQTDGAPVVGARVEVGAVLLTTDTNGNYDLNGLAAGSYLVTLLPADGRGLPAQAPIPVTLAAGATVVQHLAFLALPAPVAPAPVAPVPVAPVPVPAALPATGESDAATLPLGLAVAMLIAGAALLWRTRAALAADRAS